MNIIEPAHEILELSACVGNKGSAEHVQTHSLARAFIGRTLKEGTLIKKSELTGSEVIKKMFMLSSTEHEISTAHKN